LLQPLLPISTEGKEKKVRKEKFFASTSMMRGDAQHHIQATSAPPQRSILYSSNFSSPLNFFIPHSYGLNCLLPHHLMVAPDGVVGFILQRPVRRSDVEIGNCSQSHILTRRGVLNEQGMKHTLADIYRKKHDARQYTKKKKQELFVFQEGVAWLATRS